MILIQRHVLSTQLYKHQMHLIKFQDLNWLIKLVVGPIFKTKMKSFYVREKILDAKEIKKCK